MTEEQKNIIRCKLVDAAMMAQRIVANGREDNGKFTVELKFYAGKAEDFLTMRSVPLKEGEEPLDTITFESDSKLPFEDQFITVERAMKFLEEHGL